LATPIPDDTPPQTPFRGQEPYDGVFSPLSMSEFSPMSVTSAATPVIPATPFRTMSGGGLCVTPSPVAMSEQVEEVMQKTPNRKFNGRNCKTDERESMPYQCVRELPHSVPRGNAMKLPPRPTRVGITEFGVEFCRTESFMIGSYVQRET